MHDSHNFDYLTLLKHITNNGFSLEGQIDFLNNLKDFFAGVELYHKHQYKRSKQSYKVIWSEGSTRLFDYSKNKKTSKYSILIIPSLINKSYILDLKENLSLTDFLAENNINTYLIDWGELIGEEEGYSTEDFIIKKIIPIIELLTKKLSHKIIIAGYCMGGIMALAASQLFPQYIKKIALIATPWDFSGLYKFSKLEYLTNEIKEYNLLKKIPGQMIQSSFSFMDPEKVFSKFIKFSKMDQSSQEAENFIAVEQWINDGISLPMKVAQEFIFDFIVRNDLVNNRWMVGGQVIDPSKITKDFYIFIPYKDKIVPFSSSMPLVKKLQNKKFMIANTGHIGLVIGNKSKENLWIPLLKWIKDDIVKK